MNRGTWLRLVEALGQLSYGDVEDVFVVVDSSADERTWPLKFVYQSNNGLREIALTRGAFAEVVFNPQFLVSAAFVARFPIREFSKLDLHSETPGNYTLSGGIAPRSDEVYIRVTENDTGEIWEPGKIEVDASNRFATPTSNIVLVGGDIPRVAPGELQERAGSSEYYALVPIVRDGDRLDVSFFDSASGRSAVRATVNLEGDFSGVRTGAPFLSAHLRDFLGAARRFSELHPPPADRPPALHLEFVSTPRGSLPVMRIPTEDRTVWMSLVPAPATDWMAESFRFFEEEPPPRSAAEEAEEEEVLPRVSRRDILRHIDDAMAKVTEMARSIASGTPTGVEYARARAADFDMWLRAVKRINLRKQSPVEVPLDEDYSSYLILESGFSRALLKSLRFALKNLNRTLKPTLELYWSYDRRGLGEPLNATKIEAKLKSEKAAPAATPAAAAAALAPAAAAEPAPMLSLRLFVGEGADFYLAVGLQIEKKHDVKTDWATSGRRPVRNGCWLATPRVDSFRDVVDDLWEAAAAAVALGREPRLKVGMTVGNKLVFSFDGGPIYAYAADAGRDPSLAKPAREGGTGCARVLGVDVGERTFAKINRGEFLRDVPRKVGDPSNLLLDARNPRFSYLRWSPSLQVRSANQVAFWPLAKIATFELEPAGIPRASAWSHWTAVEAAPLFHALEKFGPSGEQFAIGVASRKPLGVVLAAPHNKNDMVALGLRSTHYFHRGRWSAFGTFAALSAFALWIDKAPIYGALGRAISDAKELWDWVWQAAGTVKETVGKVAKEATEVTALEAARRRTAAMSASDPEELQASWEEARRQLAMLRADDSGAVN